MAKQEALENARIMVQSKRFEEFLYIILTFYLTHYLC